jgi:hypothetical protein
MQWIAVGLAAGLVMGGVAYAVVVNPPAAGDRYYACVSPSGSVRADTIRRNSPPTKCPNRTDQVQSWNAQGTTGPSGPTGVAGSGGNAFRSYVGTYTVRHTNSGCGAAQMRVELVAVAGAAPTNPFGPCLDIVCLAPNGSVSGILGVGDSCSAESAYIAGRISGYPQEDDCVNLRTALAIGESAVELEQWDANLGNPVEYPIASTVNNVDDPEFPYLIFSLTSGSQRLGVLGLAQGGQSLCTSLYGFTREFSPMVSLVGVTTTIDENPVWSVYSIA